MSKDRAFAELRDILARLYSSEEDARLIAKDAGLNTENIRFSGKAITTWNAILLQTENQRKTAGLMARSMKEFSENEELSSAWHNYLIATGKKPFSLPDSKTSWPLGWASLVVLILIGIGVLIRQNSFFFDNLLNPSATTTAVSISDKQPLATFTPAPEATDIPSLESVSISQTLAVAPMNALDSPTLATVTLTDTPILPRPTSSLPTETPTSLPTNTPVPPTDTPVPPTPTPKPPTAIPNTSVPPTETTVPPTSTKFTSRTNPCTGKKVQFDGINVTVTERGDCHIVLIPGEVIAGAADRFQDNVEKPEQPQPPCTAFVIQGPYEIGLKLWYGGFNYHSNVIDNTTVEGYLAEKVKELERHPTCPSRKIETVWLKQ